MITDVILREIHEGQGRNWQSSLSRTRLVGYCAQARQSEKLGWGDTQVADLGEDLSHAAGRGDVAAVRALLGDPEVRACSKKGALMSISMSGSR
jgi:hypothetical protein